MMLSQIPWGTLNGTRCPKSQPAILDQTIFKLRLSKLKTFSYKVQCSKEIIFTVITSTPTRVSVLHSHKFDKVLMQWSLFKWYQVFELKSRRPIFEYFLLKASISLYINIFLSQACSNNILGVFLLSNHSQKYLEKSWDCVNFLWLLLCWNKWEKSHWFVVVSIRARSIGLYCLPIALTF